MISLISLVLMSAADYRNAYETAKIELADLIATQDKVARRIMLLRESLKMLGRLCESEEVVVEPSAEAEYLLAHSTLAQEIQGILQADYPGWQRPHEVKAKLERLGHDLGKYKNPQATIHMVLKRMVDSREAQEGIAEDGKQIYRFPPTWQSIADALLRVAEDATSATTETTAAMARIASDPQYGQLLDSASAAAEALAGAFPKTRK